jgi:glycosyltransferase involved in cell wall biosynthesis
LRDIILSRAELFLSGQSILKILHIINSVDPAGGGPVEAMKQLGVTLVSLGHQVEIASLDSPNAPHLVRFPLSVHALGPRKLNYGFSTRFVPWLRTNRNQYDAIVVNGMWQYHSFGTWRALQGSNTPYVVFTHGMLDPWFKNHYPLKHLKKWMYWPWAEYRVLRDARAVLFTCEEERRLARSSFWLYRCNEVVVSFGTAKSTGDPDTELKEFFAHYPDLKGKKLALFMGRIHPKKGCDLLIEAFANVLGQRSDWQLVLAGPDQVGWREELSCRATQLGLAPRLTWTDMLSGAMKWGAIRAAEIFVLPSHQENFGIAVAEALAAGVPVLVSDKVNIWREIDADGAGVVSEDTLRGTCKALQSYVEMSVAKKLAMRRAAAECFEHRFEIKRAARSLQDILTNATVVKQNALT